MIRRLLAAGRFLVDDGTIGVGAAGAVIVCAFLARGPAPHPGVAAMLLFIGIAATIVLSRARAASRAQAR